MPPKGAPDKVDNYANEFPFEMTEADLKRGQQRYNIYCALCHGAAGDGNGKIVERGFLRPPSYHLDPAGKLMDTASTGRVKDEEAGKLPQGYSRRVRPVRGEGGDQGRAGRVHLPGHHPGFGGMPDHASQIPPADRWRIAAYIRALQLSQGATVADLPRGGRRRPPRRG